MSGRQDKGYAEMSLRIEADGYVPQVIHGLKKGDQKAIELELKPDPGIGGSVLTPGGKRSAHDATVVLAMIRRSARLKGSTFPELVLIKGESLRDQWERPTVVQPDENGRFTLPNEPDPTAVVLILHGDGVFVQRFAEWKKATDVVLERWGRINGSVRWGGDKIGAGEKVDLSIFGDAYGYPDIIVQSDATVANEEGHFVFERVLPGRAQLSCPIEVVGGKVSTSDSKDGKPTIVTIETSFAGASAEVVERRVTAPIEDSISTVEAVRSIKSTSEEGRSLVTVEFDTEHDIDKAANNLREAVSEVLDDLPDEAGLPEVAKAKAGDGEKSSVYLEGRYATAEIGAATTAVVIGGKGRSVIGRLTGIENPEGITFRVHPNAPHFGGPGDDTQWVAWSAFRRSPDGATFFRDGLKVAQDGSFEIPKMLPGNYQIFFTQKDGKTKAGSGVFRLPREDWEGDSEPFDAGEFRAR